MRKYILSTDSTADLPDSYIEEKHLDVHPICYAFGDDVYGDDKIMPVTEFYNRLRNGELPTTMAANPAQIEKHYRKWAEQGYDILHLAFSSGLSSTYNNCCIAADEVMEDYPDCKIIVIDTLCASMGEGLLVYYAVKAMESGKSMDEVAEYTQALIPHLCHHFTVDDLFHLYRGGRVSKTAAFVGSLAGVKPLLHVDNEGHLNAIAKVRGRKKSLNALVDKMQSTIGDHLSENDLVFISHSDCLEDAQYVANLVMDKFNLPAMINYIGPTIGTHTGVGTVTLFFIGETR